MDNSYFIYSNDDQNIDIERFHNCTWEFDNNSSLVEFGFEISANSIQNRNNLSLTHILPWCTEKCEVKDLYDGLKDADNSRFIFNDTVSGTDSLNDRSSNLGVIYKFNGRNVLCILPVTLDKTVSGRIKIDVNLSNYNNYNTTPKPNIYFRFYVKPKMPFISTRKNGIAKSTIIYDIKINERRNIPHDILNELTSKDFCRVKHCFCFNILPNSYEIVFFDNTSLKNVRNLEFNSFNRYLGDTRIKKDELIVVFNKKEN